MAAIDLAPDWWESLLNKLVPSMVTKHSMTPKKINTKKMWDKLKDMKLQDLGLTEASLDKFMKSFCNNSVSEATYLDVPSDSVGAPKITRQGGHKRNKSSGADLTPLRTSDDKRHFSIPHIHLPFKEKDKESHHYSHKEAKSMGNILTSVDNEYDDLSYSPPLHRGSLPSPTSSPQNSNSNYPNSVPIPRDRAHTDSVVVVEEDSNIRRFRHKLNNKQEAEGKGRDFKEVVESQYGSSIEGTEQIQPAPSPPLRHSLSAVMDTYKRSGDVIDISDALEDSPMFRQKTKLVESDLFEFGKQLKSTLKLSEECCNETVNLSETMSKLADAFVRFREAYDPKVLQDQLLESGLQQFSKVLEGVEALRSSLISEIKTVMYEPMSSLQHSIKELKGFAKKFEKHAADFEAIRDKYSKNYTKKNEVELMHAKNKMRLSAMNLTFQLNELEQRKKFQHLEGICRFMMAHRSFIEKSYKMFQTIDPVVKEVYDAVMQKRQEFDKFQERMKRRRITVEIAVAQLPISMESKNNKNVKAEHQGYLYKKSNHMLHPVWKKRYFVVTGGMLLEKKELNTVNCVPLLTCSAKPRADIDKRCFELVTPDKSYIMQAESEEAQVQWVSVLQNVIAQQLNSQALGTSQNYQKSQALKDPISWLKEQLTASNRDVNQFFSCADCGAEGSEWCSLNLGIFTCIECSGIHRSLGVHISKVRSLQLDGWDENNLKYMLALGNANVNSVFEHTIPSNWTKPNAKSDREAREKFIRAKYQHKTFVNPTAISKPLLKLFDAASKGDYMMLLKLFAQGVDLETVDDIGRTPLHLATQGGHMVAVQFLVFNRSNIAAVDRADRNALHYAADSGLNEILSFLVKNCETNEPIHHKDASNQEPMDIAISNEHTECINVFLESFSKN